MPVRVGHLTIYSNDGTEVLASGIGLDYTFDLKSDGLYHSGVVLPVWNAPEGFIGFANNENSSEIAYAVGDTNFTFGDGLMDMYVYIVVATETSAKETFIANMNSLNDAISSKCGTIAKRTITEMTSAVESITSGGGVKIEPVTNLTLSNKGVLSWNAPDISELTSQGYTVALNYGVYVNDELKVSVTSTSATLIEYLVEGENKIIVIAKAEVKYFESETEIVEIWIAPSEPIAVTLSTTLPSATSNASAVAINGKAYIFGGSGSSILKTIIEFDSNTNTVTTLSTTLPSATSNASAVAINGKAYIFGGSGSSILKTIIEFDSNTNTVTTLSTTLPTALYGLSAVAINGKAYIFGGAIAGGTKVNTIIEFDPNTNTVTTLSATLPSTNTNLSSVAINDKVYILGGAFFNTIIEYDPTTSTVTTLSTTLPTALYGLSAVAINDKAYIFGGTTSGTDSGTLNTIIEFDSNTNTVTTLSATLPTAMRYASAVAINDKAYIFGGEYSGTLDTIIRVDNLG